VAAFTLVTSKAIRSESVIRVAYAAFISYDLVIGGLGGGGVVLVVVV